MKLPFDLLSQNYIKPKLYLCEVNKEKICQLETISLSGTFKFNAYSEITCVVGRTYTNMITGETQVNPFYSKIEALRLLYLEGFGYFEIQEPEINSDGIQETKTITAYSLEYRLSQRYLENFKINTGEADSLEVVEAGASRVIPITLVNAVSKKLSLLDLALEKVYDWQIGFIDESLKTMSRQFNISRASVYDFIVQDICEKFNCFAIFDTINNKINLYAEALISKHIGDGVSNTFVVSPPYDAVGTVTIDSYKTTQYIYDPETGYVTFNEPPENGARIEITDGSQEKWQTDVYISFENLAQEVNISYSAEDIKTVLTVKGQEDLDIREVNMGLPYIVDLSYYYTIDWMGKDLYDAYTKYLQTSYLSQEQFAENSEKMLELVGHITYETQRLSLQYSIADNVTSTTVGKYYVRGGTAPDYYYKEVQLPDEYNASIEHYYMLSGSDLDEDKFSKLYSALQEYFSSEDEKKVEEIDKLKDSFAFMETNTLESLSTSLSNATTLDQKNIAILNFFDELWDQLGKTPLESLYLESYKKIESTNKEAGWSETTNNNYWRYYPVTLVISSLEKEITDRKNTIAEYQEEYSNIQKENNTIANSTSIYNNFTHDQLVRLSPFLREDEYTDDNFVETDSDTIEILMKTKKELLECGKIELAKLCEPKLSFSMDMANIFALAEFEPIISQFQLGNLINVVIRPDYIKKARLLAVDINFDDFSDFSCEFGELTSLRTPSSIHADLLANALTAGNSVASNQSYWEKGADLATSTDITIHNGLLDAIEGIYNADKSVLMDNHGILLRKMEANGEYSPYQIWLTNNNILVSADGFQTASTGIGVFDVNGQELYGVLAKAVMSGYIESSSIVGGTIKIGKQLDGTYAFEVHADGSVTMNGSSNIAGVSASDLAANVYSCNIAYLSGSNMFGFNDKYIVAQPVVYKGKTEIDAPFTNEYYEGHIEINNETGVITTELSGAFSDGKYLYFVYYENDEYKIVLAKYSGGTWTVVNDNPYQYVYSNNSFINGSRVALIEKANINQSFELQFLVKDANGNVITTASSFVFDIQNTIVSDTEPIFPVEGQLWIDTSNGGHVLKMYTSIGWKNTSTQSGGAIYTSRPISYSKGDIWILTDGEQCGDFTSGSVLKATVSAYSEQLNETHWTDTMEETTATLKNIRESFTWDDTGIQIAKRVTNSNGQISKPFYVHIDSTRMGFHSCTETNGRISDVEVVHVGNNSATIQNATFEGNNGTNVENDLDVNGSATFNSSVSMYNKKATVGFIWKVEDDGSFSLVN